MYTQNVGTILKNGYIVIEGKFFQVVVVSTSKANKHGHAKCYFVGIDIFNGKNHGGIAPSFHHWDVPHLDFCVSFYSAFLFVEEVVTTKYNDDE